jgi:hypothetical protein
MKPLLLNKKKIGIKIKKAQDFTSFFFVIVIMLTIALFLLILNKVWNEIKNPLDEGLQSAMPSDTSVNITETLNKTSSSGLMFDKLIPFIIIGLFAFVLITAGAFMQHPIMIFVGIIILGVAILIAVVYSNLYNSISSTDEFSFVKSQMGIQDLFMHYLPVIIFVMAIGIGAAIIWSKKGGSGGSY